MEFAPKFRMIFLLKLIHFTPWTLYITELYDITFYSKEIVQNKKVVSKLQSIHSLTTRKHKLTTQQAVVKARLAASRSLFGAPLLSTPALSSKHQADNIAPEWAMRRSSINEITHPLRAINFLINSLHINPK